MPNLRIHPFELICEGLDFKGRHRFGKLLGHPPNGSAHRLEHCQEGAEEAHNGLFLTTQPSKGFHTAADCCHHLEQTIGHGNDVWGEVGDSNRHTGLDDSG